MDVESLARWAPFAYALLAGVLLSYAWHTRVGGPAGWRATEARVRRIEVVDGDVLVGRTMMPGKVVQVTFTYAADGREWESAADAARVLPALADQASRRWQPGTPVRAWYDPADPSQAALASPTRPVAMFCAVVGVVALGASIATALGR